MTDQPPSPGHWKASDGNWYPPEQASPPPPPAPPPPAMYAQGGGVPGQPQVYGAPRASNGFATAALVLGILSILLFWTFGFGVIAGILAIVFGIVGRSRAKQMAVDSRAGQATAGIVTGVLGVLAGLAFIALIVIAVDEIDFDEINSDPPDGVCDPDRFIQDPDC
ncbi:DUF4190 domain-containing protein [Actinospongicola halichondriae]|uniref:DUF4190 domain-containing protein n=1 Tax=Actinospongicola halichondriae TaxID=3236844 RepID=UPI003D453AEE